MLRLLAVCGLLTIVFSLPLVEEEDDRVEDRAWFREQGLSEDVIDRILSQVRNGKLGANILWRSY